MDEGQLEVSSINEEVFKSAIRVIWVWKNYNSKWSNTGNKILDIKNDIVTASKDISIDLLLQVMAENGLNGVNIGPVNMQTFPVAGYLLNKFLNGPTGDVTYDNNHWISQKIKDSSQYKEITKEFLGKDTSNLLEGENLFIGSGSLIFEKNMILLPELDLYFGIKKFSYKIEAIRENNIIYSIVTIDDDYDFPKDADYGGSLGETLNYLGYYNQTNLNGQIYHWTSIIKQEIISY